MPLICTPVSITWDLLCCGNTADFTQDTPPEGILSVVDPQSQSSIVVSKEQDDGTCPILINDFSLEWDPATGTLCTCPLPANIGTNDDEHLLPGGTLYRLSVNFRGVSREFIFQLDADRQADYAALFVNSCLPVCHVEIDNAPPLTDLFSERVCATVCIQELTNRVTVNEIQIAALQAELLALEYVTSVTVGAPDANGNVDITYTTNLGNTSNAGQVPEPADVFVNSTTTTAVANPDGSETTTFTIGLSDGSTHDFNYVHTPSAVPTAIDIDPATGTVTITFTNPDGTTFDLADTTTPFADTNTTNSTFVWDQASSTLTITDSDGAALPVVITRDQAVVVVNSDYLGTVTDQAGATDQFISRLDDCEGNPLDISVARFLTIGQGHAPTLVTSAAGITFDASCAPALPDCPIEGMTTWDDQGITWRIEGGAWVVVAFTPKETRRVMNDDPGGTTVIDDATLAATVGAGYLDINTLAESYTNTDCVPVVIEADIRVVGQQAGAGGNFWSFRMTPDNANTTGFVNSMGSPDSIFDTRDIGRNQVKDLLWNKWFTNPINPGDTVDLSVITQYRVDAHSTDPGFTNAISSVGLTGRMQIRRSI